MQFLFTTALLCVFVTLASCARTTKTRTEVYEAMEQTTSIPASHREWIKSHTDIHHQTAKMEKRSLSSDELFSIHSMTHMQEIMEDVFAPKNMKKLADKRSASLLETNSPDHHVTHDLDLLVDVIDAAETASQQAHSLHQKCSKTHTHIMTHHPSHPSASITSLFELVKIEKKNQKSGNSLFINQNQQVKTGTRNVFKKFYNVISNFMAALDKLWTKLKRALTVLANILLHVLGNTYLGLGLQAEALPVPSVGPVFSVCLDSTGILFGPESAWSEMQKAFQKDMDEDDARSTVEIQALNKEKPKVSTADLDDLSSNGKDVFANTKVMDANTQASVKNTFKAFGKIAKTNLEEDAKAKLEHKLKQKELNKQLNKDTMMFLEISQRITKLSNFKIGGMNKIVDPDPEEELKIDDMDASKFEVKVPKSSDMVIPTIHMDTNANDTPKESVTHTEKTSDSLFTSAEEIDVDDTESKKEKKTGGIKKFLATFKNAIVAGWKKHKEERLRNRKLVLEAEGIVKSEIEAKMKAVRKQLRDGIPSGALRMCFNMPMAGIVPIGLRLSLATSLKMVKRMSLGVAASYEPYLERKAAELHADNMIQSMSHGKAERRIGLYMFACAGAPEDNEVPKNEFANFVGFQKSACAKDMRKKFKEDEKITKKKIDDGNTMTVMMNPEQKKTFFSARRKLLLGHVYGVDPVDWDMCTKNGEPIDGCEITNDKTVTKRWKEMPPVKKKQWIIAAKAQTSSIGKEWHWALDSDVSAVVNQDFWTGFKKFVKGQLPYIVTKMLTDKLNGLAKVIEKVLGIKRLDKHDMTHLKKQIAAKSALIEIKTHQSVTGVVKRPLADDVFFIGDQVKVVWDQTMLQKTKGKNGCKEVEILLQGETLTGDLLLHGKGENFGRWKFPADGKGEPTLPDNDPDDRLCGGSERECNRVEIDLAQNTETPLIPGNYYFRAVCGDFQSSDENKFELRSDKVVVPELNPCRASIMVSFGLFPFKYPIGLEWDLKECSKVITSKLKNMIGTYGKEAGGTQVESDEKSIGDAEFEATPTVDSGEAGTARTAAVDPSNEETAETESAILQLDSARDNTDYGLGVIRESANEDDGCNSLNIYGGVEVDLSLIEMALYTASSFHSGLKAAAAITMAVVQSKNEDLNDLARAYTPTKQELQIELIYQGYLLSEHDVAKDELFELVSEVADDVPLTPAQVATLKNSNTLLMLIISDKQTEALAAKQMGEKKKGAKMAKNVGVDALKYYYILESGEAIAKFMQGKSLNMNIHGSIGPMKSAVKCMGTIGSRMVKKIVSRLMSKSLCIRECSMPNLSEEEIKNKPDSFIGALTDDEQCSGASIKLNPINRPKLPTCAYGRVGYFSSINSKTPAFCQMCKAVGETCGMHNDCSTDLCLKNAQGVHVCSRINKFPGEECIKDTECRSGQCIQITVPYAFGGVCSANEARCNQPKADMQGKTGGCLCKADDDCAGNAKGRCKGSVSVGFYTWSGGCAGPPPPPKCNHYDSVVSCCAVFQCEWKGTSGGTDGLGNGGKCVAGGEIQWPHRPVCDGSSLDSDAFVDVASRTTQTWMGKMSRNSLRQNK